MSDLQEQIKKMLEKQIKFFKDETFDDPKSIKKILAEMPDISIYDKKFKSMIEMREKEKMETHVKIMYETPLLEKNQEIHMFKKMNYLKYKLSKRRLDLSLLYKKNKWICEKRLEECCSIERKYIEIRNNLTTSNLRLVYNFVGKKIDNFIKKRRLEDSIYSLAFEEVLRCVENFDWTKGWKFSTYCSNNIYFNYLSNRKDIYKHYSKNHCVSINIEREDKTDYFSHVEIKNPKETLRHLFQKLEEHIDDHNSQARPQSHMRKDIYLEVLSNRYGVNLQDENNLVNEMTYQDLGEKLNVSKERIRQIEHKAIKILQQICQDEKIIQNSVI